MEQRPEPARGGHGGDVEGEPTADEYGHVAGEVSVHQPKGSGDGRAGRKAFQDQHDGGDGPPDDDCHRPEEREETDVDHRRLHSQHDEKVRPACRQAERRPPIRPPTGVGDRHTLGKGGRRQLHGDVGKDGQEKGKGDSVGDVVTGGQEQAAKLDRKGDEYRRAHHRDRVPAGKAHAGSDDLEGPSGGSGSGLHCAQRTWSAIVTLVRKKSGHAPKGGLLVSVAAAPDPPVQGWWRDPHDPGLIRYHDGVSWTAFVQRLDTSSTVRVGRPVEMAPSGASYQDAAPKYLADPAPDPPTRGWWLDPDDPSLVRFHDGRRWTDKVGRSTAPRPDVPGYQGLFVLGAGRRGIPLGRPLAPGSGTYFSAGQLYWFLVAIVAGLILVPAGAEVGGGPGWVMIAVGGFCLYQGFVRLPLGAWRAGFRIPGFRRDSTPVERFLGFAALAAIAILAFGFISGVVSAVRGR